MPLSHIGKIFTIPVMGIRVFFSIILCLFLMPLSMGQELSHFPVEETVWGNPFPGLGNVSPGSATPLSSLPSTVTLYAGDLGRESFSDLPPIPLSTDLYLARFPSNQRTGAFQKVNFNTLWVPKSGSSGLGMTELDLSAMFGLPLPTPDSPLLLTPKFSTTFFNADHWNETFHTTGLSMMWLRPIIRDKFTFTLGASALYSGDFHAKGSDTLRFPIHVAGLWNFNPRTRIVFGVVYADRRDSYNWFPMAGLIWTPNNDISVELLVPRMRVAQRVRWFDSAAGGGEDWLYTAFEFGSGSWGYKPIDGRVEYRDLRLLLGYERRTAIGLMLGLEVGYMFDRKLEFERFGNDRPSDAVFLRLRSSF